MGLDGRIAIDPIRRFEQLRIPIRNAYVQFRNGHEAQDSEKQQAAKQVDAHRRHRSHTFPRQELAQEHAEKAEERLCDG
jgi:hypothetical protein